MADVMRASQAEERVRVLEQYIRDMSIRNMQRIQTSETEKAGPSKKEEIEKREEALNKKAEELAARERDLSSRERALEERREEELGRLRGAILAQGHELASARSELEKLRRDHWVVTEQLTSGTRRLAHYASRYLSENAKVWDLTASTTSTASTVSSLSHMSTGSGDSNPSNSVPECPQGLDGTQLRADDSTDYSTFPSEATLACDPCEFLRKLRSDLKRLGLVEAEQLKPASVLALGASHLANEPASGWAENPELHERIEEVWRSVEERIGRVEGGLRTLYARLELVLASNIDVARSDPALLIRTISQALLELLPDVAHVPNAVKEVLDAVRQLSDDLAPVAKRIRLAESGFKIKEQRHALKVDLLEKRLQRLTGTLTDVQLASRRSSSSPPDEAAQPKCATMQSLEDQVVELTLGKFDAEHAVEQLRQEEQHRANRKKTAPTAPATSDHKDLNPVDGLGVFSAPAFALGPSDWSFSAMHTGTAPCMFYPPLDLTV